jgi:low temperature requirement protein LtrA
MPFLDERSYRIFVILDFGESVFSVGNQLLCGTWFSFVDLCFAFISFLYKFMSVRPRNHRFEVVVS